MSGLGYVTGSNKTTSPVALLVAAARILGQIALLWLIVLAGEWVVARLHLPVPGNVLGMLTLFILLMLGVVKEAWVADAANVLTRHLAFFFIPIAVGLMQWTELFWEQGPWLILVILLSTVAGLLTAGSVVQILAGRLQEKREWRTFSSSLPSPSPSLPTRSPAAHS
jgi:holin-like protein